MPALGLGEHPLWVLERKRLTQDLESSELHRQDHCERRNNLTSDNKLIPMEIVSSLAEHDW